MTFDIDKLTVMMNNANISGVSIATLEKNNISAQTLGISECGLHTLDKPPSQESLRQFDSSCYFITPQAWFYFDKAANQLNDLNINKEQHKQLTDFFLSNKDFALRKHIPALSNAEFEKITEITNHTHQAVKIDSQTQFRAASLSKPLFSYLILRLIEENNRKKAALGLRGLC